MTQRLSLVREIRWRDGSDRQTVCADARRLYIDHATENLWVPKISSGAGADASMGYPDGGMTNLLKLLGGFLVGLFRSRAAREAEIAFLRQQLFVATRSAPARRRLRTADRLVFVWLYRLFPALLRAAIIFKPETLLR